MTPLSIELLEDNASDTSGIPLKVGDKMLVNGKPLPIVIVNHDTKTIGVNIDGDTYTAKLLKPPGGSWRIPDGYVLPWANTPVATGPAADGEVLGGFFKDMADEQGCSLQELGWGLDTPAQIRAVGAGVRGRATLSQVKLLCQAVSDLYHYQGEDMEPELAAICSRYS